MSVLNMILAQLKDMLIPVLISVPVIIIVRFLVYLKRKEFDKKKEILIFIFSIYLVALLSVTVVPDSVLHGYCRTFPFHKPDFSKIFITAPIGWTKWMLTLKQYDEIVKNLVGNVVVFIPFGVLFPFLFKKRQKLTVLFGFLLSFFIEFIQLFMDRQSDIYDIVLNTFGVILGYLIYILVIAIKNKKSEKTS